MRIAALAAAVMCLGLGCDDPQSTEVESPPTGSFTIAVLPDTQVYSQSFSDIYHAHIEWLLLSQDALNTQFVIHVGDLVEGSWLPEQWDVAQSAMGQLDGKIPYVIAPGNHDYGSTYENRNAGDRSTLLDKYFPRVTFELMPTFGGAFPDESRIDNSYHLLDVGEEQFLIMALEFGPRDEVLTWANTVLDAHPDHLAIIATHAYLYSDDTRYDIDTYGETQMWNPHFYGIGLRGETSVNDGQQMWDKLISSHANIIAVLCGHVLNDGLGYQESQGAGIVHEILANYQMNEFGGQGFLRLLHFNPSTRSIDVRTFSPWTSTYKTDPGNEFSLSY